MTAVRTICPHCDKEIRIDLVVEATKSKPRGPALYDPGLEIDTFVIDAIEIYRSSFSTVADLLMERGIPTAKGGTRWYPASARRLYEGALFRKKERSEKEIDDVRKPK